MNATSKRSGGGRSALKRPFEMFDQGLDLVEKVILIVSIFAMATVSMINVISRNLGASISWGDETSQLLVVIVTFVGLGHGVRKARHIRVSAIHDMLPDRGQKILITFISLTTALLLTYLGVLAWEYVANLRESGRLVPSLRIPIHYIYMIAPIGLFIGAAQYYLAFVRNLISKETWLSWHHKDEYEEDVEANAGIMNEDGSDPTVKGGATNG